MKIPNAQIRLAALSNTDQTDRFIILTEPQITGVFTANYWLAHAHALNSYTLLSTASVCVCGGGGAHHIPASQAKH